ncbi:MAG: oligosaccharide flippase family protein [Desulfobacteraceae bacterium]
MLDGNPLPLRQVAFSSAIILGAKIMMVGIVYGTHLTLAWLYGAALMGTFFIATNLVMLIGEVCTLGLGFGMLRFAAVLHEEGRVGLIRRLTWRTSALILGLSLLVATGLYLGKSHLAIYLNAADLPAMLPLFALALPVFALGFLLRETLRGLGAVLWATLSQYLVQPGLLLALIVFFFFLKPLAPYRSQALSLAFFGSMFLTLLLLLWRLWVQSRACSKLTLTKSLWKDLCSYSWPFLGIIVFQSILVLGDSPILALFRPPEEVAYYASAVKLATFVTLPILAINSVVPPFFVKFYERQKTEKLEHLACTTARWIYYLTLPMCLTIILLSSELLGFFGPGFRAARWGLIIMAIGQLLCSATGSVFYLLNMTGNQQVVLRLRGWGTGFILPLMFGLSYLYGLNGMVIARTIGVVFLNLAAAWLVWQLLKIKAFAQEVLLVTWAAVAALGISWLVRLKWEALWAVATFGICYLIILGLAVWHRKEWLLLRNVAAN